MSTRYASPFIGNTGYGKGQSPNTINLAQAGTQSFAPDLANLASNTPYVRRNLIPFLIEAPRFFQYVPERDMMTRCLKAFIEVHSRTITGLNQKVNVDVGEAPIGGSGERIQVATNVTRDTSTPNFGGWELQGRAISRFIKWWITYGIGDENNKVPLVVADGQVRPENYDATFYGCTVLFVEPDPTFQEPVSAWLCTNMWPQSTPDWEGSKDASTLGQQLEYNLDFTAISDVSIGTLMYARELLQSLDIRGMNPNDTRTWLTGISADVLAAQNGLKDQLVTGAASRQNIS